MDRFIIRTYLTEDADKIGEFNKILESSYRYNRDFQPENIFCAVSPQGDIYGVVHLEPTGSCEYLEVPGKPAEYVHEYKLGIDMSSEVNDTKKIRDSLVHTILMRAQQIKKKYPDKKIRLITNMRE